MDRKHLSDFVMYYSLISIIIIFILLVYYVLIHDSLMVTFYNIGVAINGQGLLDSIFVSILETAVITFELVPSALDLLWFAGFISLIYSLISEAYFSKRDGYWSMYSYLTFGILILLFFSSLISTVSEWLYTVLIEGVLVNLAPQLTFFNFYFSNYQIINLLVIISCLVANFVDLDFAKFNSRKAKETIPINDEVV